MRLPDAGGLPVANRGKAAYDQIRLADSTSTERFGRPAGRRLLSPADARVGRFGLRNLLPEGS
jgi:hypothetical protein